MKTSVCRRLRPLALAIGATTVGGCAAWPGSNLPSAPELPEKAAAVLPADDGCAKSTSDALRCARYLSSVLSEIESDTGKWDTAYSIGTIAAGTLAAIYMKSDTDRTQALEDLAVTVAGLAGIRGVLKPDDRRRIARDGRAAVDCMIAAAEGITLYAGEAQEKKKEAEDQENAEIAANAARATLEKAKSDLDVQSLDQKSIGSRTNDNEARFMAAERDVNSAQGAVAAAQAAFSTAQDALSTAEARASSSPFARFNSAVDREFAISATLRGGARAQSPLAGNGAVAPQRGALAMEPNRFASGVLLQRQGLDLMVAGDKADKSAEVAASLLPKTLAYGVYAVLNQVRGSMADLASAPEKIAETQRDTVNGLIADLKAKVDVETEAGTKLEGASAVTPSTDSERAAEAQNLANSTKTPAKRQIATVFQQCVAPSD